MKKIQFALTVEEGKTLISEGIIRSDILKDKTKNGKVLFKGGTTVSRITEKLIGKSLRICGRVTRRGTVCGAGNSSAPHSILLDGEKIIHLEENMLEESLGLGPKDLIITGANAFDQYGNAALMAGGSGGDYPGMALTSWYTEGADCIITVGLEKLVPGNLNEKINKTGRKSVNHSWGMSVGLMRLPGVVYNELHALESLYDINVYVIGSGGIYDAKGATVFEAVGNSLEIDELTDIIDKIKKEEHYISGDPSSLEECSRGSINCKDHLGCLYLSKLPANSNMQNGGFDRYGN